MSKTIDQELTILEETKSQIKQAIIDKGQPISASDNFRSYAQKIIDISTGATIFKTIDEMNTSTNNKEGDLAIVYGDKMLSLIPGMNFKNIVFKKKVTLTEPLTANSFNLVIGDNWGLRIETADMIFKIVHWDNTIHEEKIYYQSSAADGLNFTSTEQSLPGIDYPTEQQINPNLISSQIEIARNFIYIKADQVEPEFYGLYKYTNSKWVEINRDNTLSTKDYETAQVLVTDIKGGNK